MPPVPPARLPPEVRTEYIFPRIPSDALMCLGEVVVPEAITIEGGEDAQAAVYSDEQAAAGADCRAKLGWLRDLVATWPK